MGRIMKKIRVDLFFFLSDVFLKAQLTKHLQRIITEQQIWYNQVVQTSALIPAVQHLHRFVNRFFLKLFL